MKYKFLLIIALLFIYASSCDDDDIIEPFDHAAQAVKDNDSLINYMENHYLDANNILQQIDDNQPAIYSDENLKDTIIKRIYNDEEIEFTLYYYVTQQGVNEQPTKVDLAQVAYEGFHFTSYTDDDDEITFEEDVFDQNEWGIWADLYGALGGAGGTIPVISGMSEGLLNFKSGIKFIEEDQSVTYTESGEGILFIPSGLAYANYSNGDIPANKSLIFYVKLNEVFRLDHDEDTVLSMYEDVDNDNVYSNDDTDEDGTRNIYDKDDDGDGILTEYENSDPNEDGSPTQNTDGDDIKDYLDNDDDNDGILTIDENPDPNGDGNPEDAQDSDGDGIPDYLDDN